MDFNSPKTRKILLIAIAVVVALVAVILTVTLVKNKNDKDEVTTVPTTFGFNTSQTYTTSGFLWDMYTNAGETYDYTTEALTTNTYTTSALTTRRVTTTKKPVTTAKATTKAQTTVPAGTTGSATTAHGATTAPVTTVPGATTLPGATTVPATTVPGATTTAAPATTTAAPTTTVPATKAKGTVTASTSGSDNAVTALKFNVSGDYSSKDSGVITVSYVIPATETEGSKAVLLNYNVSTGVCMVSNNLVPQGSYQNMVSVNTGGDSSSIVLTIPHASCPDTSKVGSISYLLPSGVLVDSSGTASPSHSGSIKTK